VLDAPACARLFAPGSLAEVEIAGTLTLGAKRSVEVSGRIDRLAVNIGEVLCCDFKTGTPPASLQAIAPAYLAQAALYQAALASLYPDRRVRSFLIWTEGPRVLELPPALLAKALASVSPEP
jgi:ATP-dependent helicase/nuclease subunit A